MVAVSQSTGETPWEFSSRQTRSAHVYVTSSTQQMRRRSWKYRRKAGVTKVLVRAGGVVWVCRSSPIVLSMEHIWFAC